MQVTTVYFNGIHKAFKGSFLHCSDCCGCDSMVYPHDVSHTSGSGHPQQGICIDICLPCSIVQPEVVIGKAGHPSMTHSI